MIKPKFIQRNCIEGSKIDLRQSDAVKKYKPDIIIFEMPEIKNSPNTIFNQYSCQNKPLEKVEKIIENLKISAKKYPYAKSDIAVWHNILALWKQGINVQIYNVDSPDLLRRSYIFTETSYLSARKEPYFWAFLYLREAFMAKNIKKILKNYSKKENPLILIFLQSIHWDHVKFLLKNPSKNKIWKFYFGRFKKINKKNISEIIKKQGPVLYKYWKKYSIF